MKNTTTVLQMWVRGIGAIMIVLGVLLWTGNFDRIQGVHILLGITLVLALWGLAALGAMTGVAPGLVALAFVWGLIMPILGLTQTQILPTSGHVVVQIVHLLVGMGAIGLGDTLGRRVKSNLALRATAGQAQTVERAR